jgi:hypothetical protein
MAQQVSGSRRAAYLWFIAAVLAYAAWGIRFTADGEMNWALAAAGSFCLFAGLAAWSRARRAIPPN